MMAFSKTLLAFVDYQDPFADALVGDEAQLGPILSLTAARPFEQAVLFHTHHTSENAELTEQALRQRHPHLHVRRISLRSPNPKDFSRLIAEVAPFCRDLVRAGENLDFTVCASSGTAEMRAVWMLLSSTGALPARMLQVESPAPGSGDPPRVVEMGPSGVEWLQRDRFLRRAAPLLHAIEPDDLCVASHGISNPCSALPVRRTPLDEALKSVGIFVESAMMWQVAKQAEAFAELPVPVVLQGETGTGKGLFAKLIHELGAGPGEPFVTVDCAALSTDTLQQSLFSSQGKFVQANGGTLFLDELPELSLESQGKLLRAVEEGVIEPQGERPRRVQVRIVAATNRRLDELLEKGTFRKDLYYRLNECTLTIPPLRERKSEFDRLASFLLEQINRTVREPRRLSGAAVERLRSHPWPGNVRELRNVLRVSVLSAKQDAIRAADLQFAKMPGASDPFAALPAPYPGFKVKELLERLHDWYFDRALEATAHNQQQASLLLGVTKAAVGAYLRKKMLRG